jgi:HAMP domain-containing protein
MSAAAGPVLRDIHLPAAPSWWPPAPGWWILAGLALLALAWLAWRLHRRARLARRTRVLERAWQELLARHPADRQPAQLVAGLSELLRRCARLHAPQALPLQGEAWLAFLDGDDARRPFREGPGRLLLDGPYRPQVAADEAQALAQLVAARLPRFVEARTDA